MCRAPSPSKTPFATASASGRRTARWWSRKVESSSPTADEMEARVSSVDCRLSTVDSGMSLLVPPRHPTRELLDDQSLPFDEMMRSLADIDRVHRNGVAA